MKHLLRCLLACLVCCATPLAAKETPEIRQILAGEPVQLAATRAYVLVRLDTDFFKFSAHILRIPSTEEMEAYEAAKRAAFDKAGEKAGPYESFVFDYGGRPNFLSLNPKKPAAMAGKIALVLAEIPPGDYVLYGEGLNNYLYQCFCFGTVGFTARAGTVTDLGTMFFAKAWAPSPIPELAGEVDLGRTAVMDYGLFATALRPRRPDDALPAGLDPASVSPATFHAVGPFVDTNTLLMNRLAAIPGVLAYDSGRVIDVAEGKEALPN
jgi:hypothetical protein